MLDAISASHISPAHIAASSAPAIAWLRRSHEVAFAEYNRNDGIGEDECDAMEAVRSVAPMLQPDTADDATFMLAVP